MGEERKLRLVCHLKIGMMSREITTVPNRKNKFFHHALTCVASPLK